MSEEESLETILKRGPEIRQGKGCIVARTLNSLLVAGRAVDYDALKISIDEPEADGNYVWSAPALSKLLKDKEGIAIAASSIQRHRNGGCACSR